MAAVFLHYEQGSAPFTCKIKTELGLAEALEKFSVKNCISRDHYIKNI